MYHRISGAPEPGLSPYFQVNTSPARFEEQMRLLHDEGYKVIDLLHGLSLLKNNGFSRKHVVITFDDGYEDFYSEAYPVLRKYQFPATMFLPSAFIGHNPISFRGIPCLTWTQINEMRQHGIRFGSHTVSHPKLRDLGWDEIRAQLIESRRQLEEEIGENITTLAYPYAYPEMDVGFVTRFTQELQEAGYECCVTTRIGIASSNDDPFTLKRLPVNNCDDPKFFRAKLEGGYDWLALPQRLRKFSGRKQTQASGTASEGQFTRPHRQ